MTKNSKWVLYKYIQAQGTQTGALQQPRGWNGEGDGREAYAGGDACIPKADSC